LFYDESTVYSQKNCRCEPDSNVDYVVLTILVPPLLVTTFWELSEIPIREFERQHGDRKDSAAIIVIIDN